MQQPRKAAARSRPAPVFIDLLGCIARAIEPFVE
jgi:hypothetical protein